MAEKKPQKEVINVRGHVPIDAHKALKLRQSKIEVDTHIRPGLEEVVSIAIREWAALQAA